MKPSYNYVMNSESLLLLIMSSVSRLIHLHSLFSLSGAATCCGISPALERLKGGGNALVAHPSVSEVQDQQGTNANPLCLQRQHGNSRLYQSQQGATADSRGTTVRDLLK